MSLLFPELLAVFFVKSLEFPRKATAFDYIIVELIPVGEGCIFGTWKLCERMEYKRFDSPVDKDRRSNRYKKRYERKAVSRCALHVGSKLSVESPGLFRYGA
jgi:hypothetical protein